MIRQSLLIAVGLLAAASPARAAEPCAGIARNLFVDTLISGSPTAADSASPNRRLSVGFTFANAGLEWLSLQNLALPITFSMRVLSPSGVWTLAKPSDFIVGCWTLETVDATGAVTGALPCASIGTPVLSNGSLVFTVTQPVQLCPGCGLRGAWADGFIALQHVNNAVMDRLSLAPASLTCGGKVTAIKTGQLEQPDFGLPLSPVLARSFPACAPWFASHGAIPSAPPSLSALSLTTSVKLTTIASASPAGITFPNGQAPAEALLSVSLRNSGTSSISLLGVRIPLSFSSSVLVQTSPTPRWATSLPGDYVFDCWGGAVSNAAGARADGDTDACRYASLQPPRMPGDSWALAFSGGSLCARCTLTGAGANGAMFNIKHADYAVMNVSAGSLQPSGPATVTIPASPPAFCGVPGAPVAAPAQLKYQPRCPLSGDVFPSVSIRPFPAATADSDWFDVNTELRVVPAITNGGATPLQLSSLKLNFSFDFRANAGPSAGWLRRPPSEFGFTCFFAGQSGPQPDSRSACDYLTLTPLVPAGIDAEQVFGSDSDDGAPAIMQLGFSMGAAALCPGCTLGGGQDGVLGSLHHNLYMPLSPDTFQPVALSCDEALVLPASSGGRGLMTVYPLPLPPPAPPAPAPPQSLISPGGVGGGVTSATRILGDVSLPAAPVPSSPPPPPPSCPWFNPSC